MREYSFIIRLKKAHDAFQKEVRYAYESPYLEYYNFLRALGFYSFIEQVITACAIYPRSVAQCDEQLKDLSYGLYNELGIGTYRLSSHDSSRLTDLIVEAGKDVIACLEGHNYYWNDNVRYRGQDEERYWTTDLTAVSDIKKINEFTYLVHISECHFDESDDYLQQSGFNHLAENRSH